MYHIVYLTTNIINSKIYVGVHSTYNLNDGYLGSGLHLNRAIKKYGASNFKRQIIYYCLTVDDAFELESKIIDSQFVNNKNTYNLALGGHGGQVLPIARYQGKNNNFYGKTHSDGTKQKISEYRKTQTGVLHYRTQYILVVNSNGTQFSIVGVVNLATYLNVSKKFIRKWIDRGIINYTSIKALNGISSNVSNLLGWEFRTYPIV